MATPSPHATRERSFIEPQRRRQRSVRVTVAVALLSLASAGVIAALPTGSYALVATASVCALVCGWASARIVYNELVQSRRDHQQDRAAQADAYRNLFIARAEEHAEFAAVITSRLVKSDREFREVSGELVSTERRVVAAEALAQSLEEELESRKAEEQDRFGVWEQFQMHEETLDAVADLMAWEQKVHADVAAAETEERKQA